jgi:hypothetical protein
MGIGNSEEACHVQGSVEEAVIEIGIKFICPNPKCNALLSESVAKLQLGDRIQSSHFKSLGADIQEGSPMICHRCKTPYFYNGKFHTENGWKP